jgi:lipopolysaccharide/colanic/teichoic acid biosynthesis glycosyltransferase
MANEITTNALLFLAPSMSMPPWKRFMDITGSLFGMFLFSPVMLFIALYIKIVSPGPVFYHQKRVGLNGKLFTCWKFRTMEVNTSVSKHKDYFKDLIQTDNPMKKLDETDPQIISFGRFIRSSGFDELPQLFNVLRGEMSLVGPRPCIPYEAENYETWHCRRFEAVPGLTGLWQVSGKNDTTFAEMIRFDISYAKNKSLWLDLKILLKTLPAIFSLVMKANRGSEVAKDTAEEDFGLISNKTCN